MVHSIIIRPFPPGQYTAQVLGFPEIRAVASTEQEAIETTRKLLEEWLATARLVMIDVPSPPVETPFPKSTGQVDPKAGHLKEDPDFDLYLEEIRRYRQEVDERECSNTSSTPTT